MQGRTTADGAVLVSVDNFTRAESDLYFSNIVKDGGFGRFTHIRELTPLDKQLVVRSNRDTLYSAGVFDLEAGPVTISLPEPGPRFKRNFALAWAPFGLKAPDGKTQSFQIFPQSLEDRLKFVDSKLRQMLEAMRQHTYLGRVGRLAALFGTQSGVFQFHDVELDL